MKSKSLKLTLSFILVSIISCDEPATVLTDIVHPDGSVTRKLEMKNYTDSFEISDVQVPFDSTWAIRDSLEISGEDTIWVKRAEKLFKNVDEINKTYMADSSSNRGVTRRTGFRRTFKWFNTEFRFTEKINKTLEAGYPVSDFLNAEELDWFYSPDEANDEREEGADSLRYRALDDTVSKKTDLWETRSLVSEWIYTFAKLSEGKAVNDMSFQALKAREDDFVRIIMKNDGKDFDSLWNNGILLKEFIGDANALKYKTEADSAINVVTGKVFISFDEYMQEIIMPGKLIATSGVIDSAGVISWQVQSDYFMTEDFEMWAQSKSSNMWAWIVTGVFILFVLGGIVFRTARK